MGPQTNMTQMLELMLRPAFCVKDNQIQLCNSAAQALPLSPGGDIRELLLTGQTEYAQFSQGCLYLRLLLPPRNPGACVSRVDGWDVFVLDTQDSDAVLQALALATRTLREPMSGAMLSAWHLLDRDLPPTPHAAALRRNMHQLLRILGNMSDAERYTHGAQQELLDADSLFREILEKAQALLADSGTVLHWQSLDTPVMTLADREQLERSLLNLLSNAVKFSPKGTPITVNLTRNGQMLYLRLQTGGHMDTAMLSGVFNRYLRQPGLEDIRNGLGLGMVLVRSTAANHGGTVLIDQPQGQGVRITMTLAIRRRPEAVLRSPILRPDYAGDRDHALVELSDCLDSSAYQSN